MPTDPKKEDLLAAANAAPGSEVLTKTTADALLNIKPEDMIAPSPDAEVIKGNAYRSGGWLHSPAHLELFAAADKRLLRCAAQMGMPVNRIDRVKAILVRGTKLVVIRPAAEGDLSAIAVSRSPKSSAVMINLVQLLAPAGLTVQMGWRERFEAAYVPKGSPLWPGLVIDLSQPTERRQEPVKKKEENG